MKKVLKRIATMAVALMLIVITGITMAACGSGSNNSNNPGSSTANTCNIDNMNGFYANTESQKIYWFDIAHNKAKHARLSISDEPNENGLYQLRVATIYKQHYATVYKDLIQVNRGTQAVAIYHKWRDTEVKIDELLISTYENDYDKDLSKQFYAEDEEILYTKISGLNEFLTAVFPDKDIDTDNIKFAYDDGDTIWKNLFTAL